ncbi:MAG TPA: magnesium chelatase domain-containing protein, partial [Baekduia sp.]|nr:magnesium chelatase domain-containing protein [Baekduia sp.]
CAVLSATGEVLPESLARTAIFGELALDGGLRPCRGAIAAAEGAVLEGIGSIIVPSAQAHEVGAVSGLTVLGART